MDIRTWAEQENISARWISRKLECTYMTARTMLADNRVRSIEMANRVSVLTDGKVTPKEAIWPEPSQESEKNND